jgi:hypothetical protein
MSWEENDVQRVLTGAIPIWLSILAEQAEEGTVSYRCRTRSSRNQNPKDPEALGVDVLALLGAKHVLAFEIKKNKKGDNDELPFLENLTDDQVEFLHRLRNTPYVSSYVLFDMHDSFDCHHVVQLKLQAIAQLSALAVAVPVVARKIQKDIRFFCHPTYGGSSALDAISKAFTQRNVREGTATPLILELMLEELPHTNNCVLWFLSDGFATELTLDELRQSVHSLMAIKKSELGVRLIRAYKALRAASGTKGFSKTSEYALAKSAYFAAEGAFLIAAKEQALDLLQDVQKVVRDDSDGPSMSW